jgi:ankyrin repeat protein
VNADGANHEAFFVCLAALLPRVDVNSVRRQGATLMHFTAASRGLTGGERARFAAMLIDRGARFDLRDDLLQSTPLGWACRWGRKEMVELLIARGAPVHEPDAEPWATPRAWAEKMGHTDIVAMLRTQQMEPRSG